MSLCAYTYLTASVLFSNDQVADPPMFYVCIQKVGMLLLGQVNFAMFSCKHASSHLSSFSVVVSKCIVYQQKYVVSLPIKNLSLYKCVSVFLLHSYINKLIPIVFVVVYVYTCTKQTKYGDVVKIIVVPIFVPIFVNETCTYHLIVFRCVMYHCLPTK